MHQGIDFFSGENDNYQRIGQGYLECDKTQRKNCGNFNYVADGNVDELVRLMKVASAYAFKIATPSTTGGKEIEETKYVGNASTTIRQ